MSDPRLEEIQARVDKTPPDHGHTQSWLPAADVRYLLAELRKAREALARVEGVAGRLEARAALNARVSGTGIYDDAMQLAADAASSIAIITATDLRAAVAAAKGGGE